MKPRLDPFAAAPDLMKAWLDAGQGIAKPMVAIGRISYSVYLVHWPLIAFWRLYTAGPLRPNEQALCDGATCAVVDGLRALYEDDDHLSPFGAARVSGLVGSALGMAGIEVAKSDAMPKAAAR